MKLSLIATLTALTLAAPAFAGDAALGEKDFNKCKACHSIVKADGTVVVKGGKVGPNLFGVVGRTAGTYPEFKYKDSIKALGASGFAWTEADIAVYVLDPTAFLKEKTGDAEAKSGMAKQALKDGSNVAAYLASIQ